ncbi:MAG: hypothetical protein ACETWG_09510 [Candidatus Neomarinimicrobiota bacterium]
MGKYLKICTPIAILSFFILTFSGLFVGAEVEIPERRGDIRVVESWRPDINVVGHNVLQYLFEYALERNEMVLSLAVSRRSVDDTTVEVKLRQGVCFSNGEPSTFFQI